MIFNTLQFLPFIIVVLILHYCLPWKYDKLFLLIVSYLFYASFNPPFVLILLLSTIIDWGLGKWLFATTSQHRRRALLALSVCSNMGILCYFKYSAFLVENLNYAISFTGVSFNPSRFDFVLPVGISFYTFQSMSYCIDIYRKKLTPYTFFDFTLFVSFFPQLVAGPIVRAVDFKHQLRRKRHPGFHELSQGCYLIVLGYFKKIVIADNLADFVTRIFDKPEVCSHSDITCAVIGFATQIYCDFSGYSDIAIGIALIMGFHFRRNFKVPYLAMGFSDFWKRWHISLSSWIKDYVYFPLGGNRKGLLRQMFNLLFTMTLCGLWHGASWLFIIWGGLHGIFSVGEKVWEISLKKLSARGLSTPIMFMRELYIYKTGSTLATFALVCVGWIFFRASNFKDAIFMLKSFLFHPAYAFHYEWIYIGIVVGIHILLFLNMHIFKIKRVHWSVYSVAMSIMLFFCITAWESNNVFIYFQF